MPAQKRYTPQSILSSIADFRVKAGREPVATDFTPTNGLPSAKYFERTYGGLKKFRKQFNLTESFASGETRSKTASIAFKRHISEANKIHKILLQHLPEINIHAESPYDCDDKRIRSDFKVFTKNNDSFFLDIFYARNLKCARGCVNTKIRKIESLMYPPKSPIFFLNVNDSLPSLEIKNPKYKIITVPELIAMI